jgi:hypothetical protein
LRLIVALVSLGLAFGSRAQAIQLSDAPQPLANLPVASEAVADFSPESSPVDFPASLDLTPAPDPTQASAPIQNTSPSGPQPQPGSVRMVGTNDAAIPLDRREPQRILGFMPNFRSVSSGANPHPPGWKYNFTVATEQATDYSSFIFLGITSLTAEGMNLHSDLGKGVGGFYAYSWRGFLDKTDNTYLSAWLLPSVLHEDTRYYALGTGHSIPMRTLYVISRQGVARTYGGSQTPNIAGLGGKVLTQVFSRAYYPASAASFNVLATKFSYSVMRDVAFSAIREFYPDAAAHFVRKHREKIARLAARANPSVY